MLNHGDLMVSNMLGDAPQLVDWSTAQVADPTWDMACLLAYYPGMGRYMPRLLAAAAWRAALPWPGWNCSWSGSNC